MGSCLTMITTPATMLHIRSGLGTERELTRLLSSSSDMTADGLHIQVGRSIDSQTIHIPKSVIDSCPALQDLLAPGCRIVNADPAVFAIIIEHLQSISIFGLISCSAPGHLQELTLTNDPLLTFSKAWHIGDMLRMPDLQNAITKVYSTYYTKCLDNDLNLSAPPEPISSQPFTYLRDHIGNHTKAEHFLVDFHAGLAKNHPKLKRSEHKLLPADIARLIRDRWKQLQGRRDSTQVTLSNDRIRAGDRCFKANKKEKVSHGILQVQYLCAGAGANFSLNPPVPVVETRRKTPRGSASRASRNGTRLEDLMARREKHRDWRSGSGSSERNSKGSDEGGQEDVAQPGFNGSFGGAAAQRTGSVPSPSVSPANVPFQR